MHAFFLVGFNNWGKTYQCQKLFGPKRYWRDRTYRARQGVWPFVVQQNSNDDLSQEGFLKQIGERLKKTQSEKPHLFASTATTRIRAQSPWRSYEVSTLR